MAPSSGLSKRATQGYWAAVRRMLQTRYHLSLAKAQQAIATYKNALTKYRVGDEIYHAPIEETAEGIINGGYAVLERHTSSEKKAKKPQID